mmetsp:Transcript_121762/g.221472  ORF Transcript_121762/g.221472 Transcript_121762/m.221472 type:complete len:265 (-) Transcript_121762:25-819(-)
MMRRCCDFFERPGLDSRLLEGRQPTRSIGLTDGTDESEEPEYRVRVDGFEVSGRRGRHVIYSLTVFHGRAHWPIRRRFRQVAALHRQLSQGLGRSAVKDGLPFPPPKITCRSLCFGPHDQRFLAGRASRLQCYFDALLRYIPYVDQCEALHEFLCSVDVNNMSYDALLDLEQAIGRAGHVQQVPLSEIEALPRRDVACQSMVPEAERCVICQERLESEEDVRLLPCGHQYHFACIAQWIPHSNTCCVCQSVAIPQTPLRLSPDK